MKKLPILFVILLMSVAVKAEQASLCGVDIATTAQAYTAAMQKTGFETVSSANGITTMTGSYGDYDKCKLKIYADKKGVNVDKLILSFPECAEWTCLTETYYALKDSLSKVYGAPQECVEGFFSYEGDAENAPKQDGVKLLRLVQDRCQYKTTYKADDAMVLLYLTRRGQYCYVALEFDH